MAKIKTKRKIKAKKVYSLVGEGETEKWYFQMLKEYENLPRIDIKPELPKRKKIEDQLNLLKKMQNIMTK